MITLGIIVGLCGLAIAVVSAISIAYERGRQVNAQAYSDGYRAGYADGRGLNPPRDI